MTPTNFETAFQVPLLPYRGRLAPTPSGYMHLGHARTFWTAWERANAQEGRLVLRDENLDRARCRDEFSTAMLEDLRWLGLLWMEGPDVGGPFAPYRQSQRHSHYLGAWRLLSASGCIYASEHSRRDVEAALVAPHEGADEPLFPAALRPEGRLPKDAREPGAVNWRFRVPDGRAVTFLDALCGPVERKAGIDFGDFLVWRKDGFPSYELAVVVDDHAMQISEVVRGTDLLTSTARQLLLYEALGWPAPHFCHCQLVLDDDGRRLAKRDGALSLRTLRSAGFSPEAVRQRWAERP